MSCGVGTGSSHRLRQLGLSHRRNDHSPGTSYKKSCRPACAGSPELAHSGHVFRASTAIETDVGVALTGEATQERYRGNSVPVQPTARLLSWPQTKQWRPREGGLAGATFRSDPLGIG